MRYFVTGASGFLGTHLVRVLVAAGHDVTALVYESEREATVRGLGARTLVGGFEPALLARGMRNADGVFHVAGLVSLDDRDGSASRAVNVAGVRKVFDAALAAGVRRVVHTSSAVTIGGDLEGSIFDERSAWRLAHLRIAYLDTKRQGEQLALSYGARGVEVVVCNPAGLLGPDDLFGSEAGVMFPLYLRSRVPVVPDVRNNWVDVRDVARGHVLAMERGAPGARYFLGGINTTAQGLLERLDALGGGRRRRRLVLRWPLTLVIGYAAQLFGGHPALRATSARFMRYAFWASAERAKRELGWEPRPLDVTLREGLAWFREHAERGALDEGVAALSEAPVQLDVSTLLHARPAEVFDFLADFPNLPRWMPLMRRVEVDDSRAETPGGVGAVRILHPPAGRPARETVRAFERPRLLAYSASDASLRGLYTDHTGVLLCDEDGDATRLRWLTFGRPVRNPVLRWIGRRVFAYVVRTSVRNLERRFEDSAGSS